MSLANLNAHNTTLAFANLRFEMVFSNKKKKKVSKYHDKSN